MVRSHQAGYARYDDDPEMKPRTSALSLAALILALVATTMLCGAMLVLRAARTESIVYGFMPWNLFLAWMALAFALAVHLGVTARPAVRIAALLVAAPLWLLFVPNAPYVVTDIAHLRVDPVVPFWYDVLLMATFATTGVSLGLLSIYLVQEAVLRVAGFTAAWTFALATFALCGIGVYLGRVLRWNSWDAIAAPSLVVADVLELVRDPLAHQQAWELIVLMALFVACGYGAFYAATRLRAVDPAVRGGLSKASRVLVKMAG
jgi:uncharacterized membrane protein